jgi:HlyD family secretion protein
MKALRRSLLAAALAGAAALAVLLLRPGPVGVETARATRGPFRETVDGTGRTRVRGLHVVAAPAPGELTRLLVREGDAVRAGELLAWLEPAAAAPLDARTRAELGARLGAARAGAEEARSALARAEVAAGQAAREASRAERLAEEGAVARADAEAARAWADARAGEVRMARAAADRAAREIEALRALLAPPGGAAPGRTRLALRAPAPGRVLRVHRETAGPVTAGAPLLDLGDPRALEVEVELLTAQAVRVRPGAPVELVRWGGEGALAGTVASVDPGAFTKVSALGVEEQRVHAVVAPAGPGWEGLGDGWSVEARIAVRSLPDALRVPAAALFRTREGWAVFVVEGGRVRARDVRPAGWDGATAAVEGGLAEGEEVILHPGDRVGEGARVRAGGPPGVAE